MVKRIIMLIKNQNTGHTLNKQPPHFHADLHRKPDATSSQNDEKNETEAYRKYSDKPLTSQLIKGCDLKSKLNPEKADRVFKLVGLVRQIFRG